MAAVAERRNVTIFGVFNYKGGVGKSTNTINIAAALTHLGKKVLVVDADPQCNITTFYLSADSKEAEEDGADDEDRKQASRVDEVKVPVSDDDTVPPVPTAVLSYPDGHKYAGNPILPRITEDKIHPSAPNLTFDQISNFTTKHNLYTLLNPAFLGRRDVLEAERHYKDHTLLNVSSVAFNSACGSFQARSELICSNAHLKPVRTMRSRCTSLERSGGPFVVLPIM
jgi:hypothetical protein